MQILITNHALAERTGSELFVCDLALLLRRMGHGVEIFTPRPGDLAEEIRQAGIAVHTDPMAATPPDVIHAQHHLPAMAALAAWSGVPALYHCHGFRPWEEKVPVHPRIYRYVAISPKLIPWMTSVCGVREECIALLPNFFDPQKFSKVRTPSRVESRALVFSNRTFPGPSLDAIRRACEGRRIALEMCGQHFDNVTNTPEKLLPQYDVVFATGRSALEAMASGCAVICQSDERGGELVTTRNFDELRARNFSIPVGSLVLDEKQIASQLGALNANDIGAVTQRVRAECSADVAGVELNRHYEATLAAHAAALKDLSNFAVAEKKAMVHYLVELDRYLHHGDTHFERLRTGWEATRQKFGRFRERAKGRKNPPWWGFFGK